MLNNIRFNRSSLLILGSCIAFLFAAFWLLLFILGFYIDYSRQAQELRPKLARLQGLASVEQELAAAVSKTNDQLEDLVFGEDLEASKLGTQIQQRARAIFRDAGMVVTGSQIAKPTENDNFLQISVDLNVEGTLGSLEEALLELVHVKPLMLIKEIKITPERRHRKSLEQNIEVSVKLFCLQLREGDE